MARLSPALLVALAATSLAALPACEQSAGGPDDAGAAPDHGAPDLPPTEDGTSGNRPPELERIGDRVAVLGEPLAISVVASDPDGDALTYSVYGKLPTGARFLKPERRFEWTPSELVPALFLTFVVSDGQEFDRETVRIEVVAEKSAHPPVLVPVGDQAVKAGETFELQLVATDPDGDPVSYGHEGALPKGAALDAQTGRFTWLAPDSSIGKTERITFTASDGGSTTTLEVRFVVTDGSGSGPAPPVFAPVPPQKVTVGATLTLALSATDPNGDPLTYAIVSGAPPGAKLVGNVLTYSPTASEVGLVWSITVSASDGVFEALAKIEVTVTGATSPGTCQDDAGEPNEGPTTATPLTAGTVQRTLCDSALVPVDVDWYAVDAPAGQQLEATLLFDADEGDLDLYLLAADETLITASETVTSTEIVTHTPATAQKLFLVVAGLGQESFHQGYTLELAFGTPSDPCEADGLEPNDTSGTSSALPKVTDVLSICAGDVDVFDLSLTCGAAVTATLDTAGTGDLDMGLWPGGALTGTPLAQAASEAEVETFTLASVPKTGSYELVVTGYPHGQAEGLYSLVVKTSGGCVDDPLGNTTAAKAKALTADGAPVGPYVLCCGEDWFRLPLGVGDELLVDLTLAGAGGGTAGLTLLAPDGTTQLVSKAPSAAGALVDYKATHAGGHYVRVGGVTGTSYVLDWLVEPATAPGCTALSCPVGKVCDAASGLCVSDFCLSDGDCPGGHLCQDTYCVDPCADDGDCRAGYACKGFEVGGYCGLVGDAAPGAPCDFHTDCQGSDACLYVANGGYCATAGCLFGDFDCVAGTACSFDATDLDVCGVLCADSAQCRQDDGFACIPSEGTCLPQ